MSEVGRGADHPTMAHLVTSLSVTVVFYAAVTRGSLVVARGLTYVFRKS